MRHGDIARQLLPLEPEFGSGRHLPVAAAGAVAGAAVASHHRGPGHGNVVTGAPGSAVTDDADRR
ncbi:hypothetical protein ABZT34_05045 [Streptomyces sp. NPDC005329]|uniref:hypothetical protein n=1 Tax=Streptomyces sp. NPDC005329 TaxID=3157034 RepID=UPI0033AF42B5